VWRDSDGLIDYGSGPRALALRGIAMAQLGELERAKALRWRAARGFGEEKDALNDNVEHAVPGCLVGLRVEVCALSALCAICVEACALSALCVPSETSSRLGRPGLVTAKELSICGRRRPGIKATPFSCVGLYASMI
jgi:hypothetical protein